MARPSLFTPEIAEEICDLTAQGKFLPYIAEKLNIGERTIRDWLSNDAEFSQSLARARRFASEHYMQKAQDELDAATNETIQVVRERAQHYRWMAKAIDPKYKDKVEVSGDPDSPVQVAVVEYK